MLADANTSALAPPAIASRSVPDGPYFACTATPLAASKPAAISVSASRSEPAACSSTIKAKSPKAFQLACCPSSVG